MRQWLRYSSCISRIITFVSITEASSPDQNHDQGAPDPDRGDPDEVPPTHKEPGDLAQRREQAQGQASYRQFGIALLLGYSAAYTGTGIFDIALLRAPGAEEVSSLTGAGPPISRCAIRQQGSHENGLHCARAHTRVLPNYAR
jgi:hypothetical protein